MSHETGTLEGRKLSAEYIDHKCRLLLDQQVFSCTDWWDMERMFKFLRQRGLRHSLNYCPDRKVYTAAVHLPMEKPMNLLATAKHPATAIALCGARLAELAGI